MNKINQIIYNKKYTTKQQKKLKRIKKINLTKQIDIINLKYNYIIGTTNQHFILKLFRLNLNSKNSNIHLQNN